MTADTHSPTAPRRRMPPFLKGGAGPPRKWMFSYQLSLPTPKICCWPAAPLGWAYRFRNGGEDECTLTLIGLGGAVALLIWGVHMARIAGACNEKLAFEACT